MNRRAGGTGFEQRSRRFQRPMKEGTGLLNALQDAYLDETVTVA